MPPSLMQTRTDPLAAFLAEAMARREAQPIPLRGTAFGVWIDGGLAVVATTRLFQNLEAASIEACLTFPVPVHAVLFALEARIAGRLLTARAQRRDAARETYEEAVAQGHTAVLHEEVLRGVHMLSVGQIPPEAQLEVTSRWVMTLTRMAGRTLLRIPTTVGEIYGRSPLVGVDDLLTGGPRQTAPIQVTCRNGQVRVREGSLDAEGRAEVGLDAPVELEVTGCSPRTLHGIAADGRAVSLRVIPDEATLERLDVTILLDRSSSMEERCAGAESGPSKHAAMLAGLREVAGQLHAGDAVDLWEFANYPKQLGIARGGAQLADLLRRSSLPSGGTEIGTALLAAITQSPAQDVVLVTDGKTHALDVQTLIRSERRFSVVLVGEDSLEANVGHLAALTGGQIFVASGTDIAGAVAGVIQALRVPPKSVALAVDRPEHVITRRGGMMVGASWEQTTGPSIATLESRAVAAFAAGLALPHLPEDAAAILAETEGLVSHLTSLVLVDTAGATQETVPAMRKVALSKPRTAVGVFHRVACMPPQRLAASVPFMARPYLSRPAASPGLFAAHAPPPGPATPAEPPSPAHSAASGGNDGLEIPAFLRRQSSGEQPSLADAAARIEWGHSPALLQAGDLSSLPRDIADAIQRAAGRSDVQDAVHRLGMNPIVLVIAILARARSRHDRTASRIANTLLRAVAADEVERLRASLGLV